MAESASGIAEVLTILLSSNSDEVPRHVLGKYLARPGAPTVSLRNASENDWKQAHFYADQDIPAGMTAGDTVAAWETVIKETLNELSKDGATINPVSSGYILDNISTHGGGMPETISDKGLTIAKASELLSERLKTVHQPHLIRAALSHKDQPTVHLRAESVTYSNLESSRMALEKVYTDGVA